MGDLNNRGQVVGTTFTGMGAQRAFRWRDGELTDLHDVIAPGGATETNATNINDLGTIIGIVNSNQGFRLQGSAFTADFMRHATLWQNGTLTDLGVPAGAQQSIGRDVNNFNRVAGAVLDESFLGVAAIWQNGTWTLLPSLEPGAISDASSINDLGVVVGSSFSPSTGRSSATLWFNGQVFVLDDLVSASDPSKPFVQLQAASFVNIRGDIVATGSDSRLGLSTQWYFLRLARE